MLLMMVPKLTISSPFPTIQLKQNLNVFYSPRSTFRFEEAFKEGRGIMGGKFLVRTMRHSRSEIFGSDRTISKIFKVFKHIFKTHKKS